MHEHDTQAPNTIERTRRNLDEIMGSGRAFDGDTEGDSGIRCWFVEWRPGVSPADDAPVKWRYCRTREQALAFAEIVHRLGHGRDITLYESAFHVSHFDIDPENAAAPALNPHAGYWENVGDIVSYPAG
jgi:hypothetical protein